MSTQQKRAKDRGKANEYQLRDYLNKQGIDAERVPLSGAMKSMPGDVRSQDFSTLWEAKVIGTLEIAGEKYISRINLDWVRKIREEAARAGLDHGVVVIRGKSLKQRFVLLTLEDYLSLRKL